MRIATLLFSFFFALVALADDGTLSLSPAAVMLRGDYGQSTTQQLVLRNRTSRSFSFDLVAQDVLTRNGARAFADAGTIPGSIAATAVFSRNHVDIPPGESATVTITATLPQGTAQRAIVALFRGTNRVMSGNVPMIPSIGTLLTFAVSDAVELSVPPLVVQAQTASSSLSVSHTCTNTGREPLVARGVMAIVDHRGALVGRSPFQPKRLIPGESAALGGDYGGELAPGKYRVLVTYEYEGETAIREAEVEIQ